MYRLTINHDDGMHGDGPEDPWFTLVSFSTRHGNFVHPDELDTTNVLTFLSYFEHGLCQWGLAGSMHGMPDFRWDGVGLAGAIVFSGSDEERKHFDAQTDEQKIKQLEWYAQYYTDWANGNVHYISLDEVTIHECEYGEHEEVEDIASCGNLIGEDELFAVIEDHLGYIPEDAEVKWVSTDGIADADYFKWQYEVWQERSKANA